MKKVLLTSVALLSLVAGARVLAEDGQHAPKADPGYTYTHNVDTTLADPNEGNGGVIATDQPGTEAPTVNKEEKINGSVVEKLDPHGSDKEIEDVLKTSVDASGKVDPAKPATPAKPAAPTMDQKADKADKAAAKMGGEKAAAKTLPNTAAVK